MEFHFGEKALGGDKKVSAVGKDGEEKGVGKLKAEMEEDTPTG